MSTISKRNTSERTLWTVRILLALVTLAFLPAGIMKVIQAPAVVQGFTHAGIPQGAISLIGILELSCLALYLIPQTTVLGTLLLTGYLGGAVLANIINRTDFIHALVVGLFVWAGAYLRVTELKALLPLRKSTEAAGGRARRLDAVTHQAK